MDKSRFVVSVALLISLVGCGTQENSIFGKGGGPYNMELRVNPSELVVGNNSNISLRLSYLRTGEPVEDLQLAHERLLHIFIVDREFETFAHLHVENGNGYGPASVGEFQVSHAFDKAGSYQLVVEFVHRSRIWHKTFNLLVKGSHKVDYPSFAEVERLEGYEAVLSGPKEVVSGREVEFNLSVKKNDIPTTDLRLFLGSELHGAVWREDGQHFGHLHSFTPKMAFLINEIRSRENGGVVSPVKLQEILVEVMCSVGELVYPGPRVPVRYTFPANGRYYIFAQVAPEGVTRTFKFEVNVEDSTQEMPELGGS